MPLRCSVLNLAIVDVIIRGQSNKIPSVDQQEEVQPPGGYGTFFSVNSAILSDLPEVIKERSYRRSVVLMIRRPNMCNYSPTNNALFSGVTENVTPSSAKLCFVPQAGVYKGYVLGVSQTLPPPPQHGCVRYATGSNN
ncbi:hypothetical protein TNCV_101541 [Trichonephila clavipes]|nr:hypothetical protein TNCV_101541 [Trichonephila clavipes]